MEINKRESWHYKIYFREIKPTDKFYPEYPIAYDVPGGVYLFKKFDDAVKHLKSLLNIS